MTKTVTGRSSQLEDMRADSIRRHDVCTKLQADSNHKGADSRDYPSRLEDIRADSSIAHRHLTATILACFQIENSQMATFQVTTVRKPKNQV